MTAESTKNTDTKATVVELPQYDDRGPAPLNKPQKAHVRHPNDGAHGLCLTTGFCGAWVGGVSSGKSTCLQSCLAHNHARYRYTDVFLMHPDAENAKTGEYGLCTDIKVLEHWPRIEELARAPARALISFGRPHSRSTTRFNRVGSPPLSLLAAWVLDSRRVHAYNATASPLAELLYLHGSYLSTTSGLRYWYCVWWSR